MLHSHNVKIIKRDEHPDVILERSKPCERVARFDKLSQDDLDLNADHCIIEEEAFKPTQAQNGPKLRFNFIWLIGYEDMHGEDNLVVTTSDPMVRASPQGTTLNSFTLDPYSILITF